MKYVIITVLIFTFFATFATVVHSQDYRVPEAINTDIYDVPVSSITVQNGTYFYRGMYVEIIDSDEHFADVNFSNIIVPSGAAEDITFENIQGLPVKVLIKYGAGDNPDIMAVIPPAGFVAVPQELSVEEDTIGVIEIHEMLLG